MDSRVEMWNTTDSTKRPTKKRKIASGYTTNIICLMNNQQTLILPDGSKYSGALGSDGLPEGHGRAVYDDGGVYEGEWLAGKWHGSGSYSSKNLLQQCDDWRHGKSYGWFTKSTYGEHAADSSDIVIDGKLEGETLAGELFGKAHISAVSHCGRYRFLTFGNFRSDEPHGFAVQLNYFGKCADGSGGGELLPNYCVGDWLAGKLWNGKKTERKADGSWCRTTFDGGFETKTCSTLFKVNASTKTNNNSNNIAAIKTAFGGYTFQSRTEARWAVFFTELGLHYLYEPYTLQLQGKRSYTCDFLIPYGAFWVEIKGGYPTNKEIDKAVQLCKHSELDVHIFYGRVGSCSFEMRCCTDVKIVSILYRQKLPPQQVETLGLAECERCGRIEISKQGVSTCNCTNATSSQMRLKAALTKARYYSF